MNLSTPNWRYHLTMKEADSVEDFAQMVFLNLLKSLRGKKKGVRCALSTMVVKQCSWTLYRAGEDYGKRPKESGQSIPDYVDPDSTDNKAEKLAHLNELRRTIHFLLRTLTYRERLVLELRYGLGDGNHYTLEETGRVLKVTKTRTQQIERKAIRKLQYVERSRKLRGFVSFLEDEEHEDEETE